MIQAITDITYNKYNSTNLGMERLYALVPILRIVRYIISVGQISALGVLQAGCVLGRAQARLERHGFRVISKLTPLADTKTASNMSFP